MTGAGVEESGARAARFHAEAVLRVRGRALAVALLPVAVAVVLLVGGATGRLTGTGWDVARGVVSALALSVLLGAAGVALLVARARPAVSPTVPIPEATAPDLYRLVRDLADRLGVPAPSAVELTPDCDSWLEDRGPAGRGGARGGSARHPGATSATPEGRSARVAREAPVLVIGSPFLWWMRVAELRAVLAPVVAGTGPSAYPEIAAARRFLRGLDAAVAVTAARHRRLPARLASRVAGRVVRHLLRGCRADAVEMERGVAAAAAERARSVDYGLRIVAQEQVGLAYAGWDRLLTRVALPAWRMGRWPAGLDAGVVSALTELSRRDRLATALSARLGERPACDLLEEPGVVDRSTSLLAARLFHGGPAAESGDWEPVEWADYPEEIVDRIWRTDAARLHRVLDRLGVRRVTGAGAAAGPPPPPSEGPGVDGPTLAKVLDHLAGRGLSDGASARAADGEPEPTPLPDDPRGIDHAAAPTPRPDPDSPADPDAQADPDSPGSVIAAGLRAELAREEALGPIPPISDGDPGTTLGAPEDPPVTWDPAGLPVHDRVLWGDEALPVFPPPPSRSGRELLVDHVTAMVCCAAVDTAGAAPGLDWLDGPSLLIEGERVADLNRRVFSLVDTGDAAPLRDWLADLGIRPEKPVRLA
ncbi:hypothetical protein [Streptomyces sp. HSG2]|uniref:hypothetical protein n=1 Tax=Streptomyces sp. HSG2 TaxID=2797167 RepID=UPI0019033776|nr:hypothetical protein [Streptomyces sp. HSG2]